MTQSKVRKQVLMRPSLAKQVRPLLRRFGSYSLERFAQSLLFFGAVACCFCTVICACFVISLFSANPMPLMFGVYFAVMNLIYSALIGLAVYFRRSV
jgi:hypothetical protein